MSPWFLATQIIQWIGLFVSMIVNLFLLHMINSRSPKNIGQYRYLMISFAMSCLLFSVLSAIARPTILSHGHSYILFSPLEKETLVAPLRWFLTVMYVANSAISIGLTVVQFVYRYCVICKPSLIPLFSGKRLLYWYLGVLAIMIDWIFLCVGPSHKNAALTEQMRIPMLEQFDLDIDEVEYLGVQFIRIDEHGHETFSYGGLFLVINVTCVLAIVSLISFFCGLKTYYKTLAVIQANNYDAFNNQIFFALIAQTLIPFLFLFTPMIFVIVSPIWNLNVDSLTFPCTILMTMYPILDPMAILFIVSNYRKCLVPMLKPNRWRAIVRRKLIANQITVEAIDVDIL